MTEKDAAGHGIAGDRRRTLMLVLVAALVVVVGLNIWGQLRKGDGVDTVDTDDEVASVVEVLSASEGKLRTLRGFVFEDALGLRICNGRQVDPVACVGPFLDLAGFDLASVPTDSAEVNGREIFYSADPVTLIGTLSLTTFTVEDVITE